MASAAKPTPYLRQVAALTETLFDGLRGQVHVRVGRGTGAQTFSWWPRAPYDLLPEPLLRELADYDPPDDVLACPSTLDQVGQRVLDTRCLWAEVPLAREVAKERGRPARHVVDPKSIAAARARLDAFPLRPSLVVDQGWSLFVGWLLTETARLDRPETLARVEAAQRALAERVGGRTDVLTEPVPGRRSATAPGRPDPTTTVAAWHPSRRALRVPASRNHDDGSAAGAGVELEHLDASRRYPLDEVEKALSAGRSGKEKKR